jgi:hypothetical protein
VNYEEGNTEVLVTPITRPQYFDQMATFSRLALLMPLSLAIGTPAARPDARPSRPGMGTMTADTLRNSIARRMAEVEVSVKGVAFRLFHSVLVAARGSQ